MIHIEHLHKSIGSTSILSDVSLHIAKGEVVGLLGPNGAGKSTLMKVLTGLWKAEKGSVKVCGVDVLANPDDVHEHIGYLPEQNPLYADMYVREYLTFIARVREGSQKSEIRDQKSEIRDQKSEIRDQKSEIRDQKSDIRDQKSVEELIERVGLTPQANKRIRELSKGYKQRVGLAAAMTGDPEVLILDEPTTGLDPNQLEDIRALIRDLGERHTVILSTHILQEVNAICSRVVIINHGQIRLDKPLNEIEDLEQTFKQATHE